MRQTLGKIGLIVHLPVDQLKYQQQQYHFRLHSIGGEFEPRHVDKNDDWQHGDDNDPTIRDGVLNALRSKYDEQDTVEEGSTWTHGGHVQNPEIHYGVCQVCLFGPNGCNHNETPHLLDQLYCHQARTCQKKTMNHNFSPI